MSDIREAFEKIQRQFTSTNSIDVERATILRSDWELAKQHMEDRAQGDAEPVALPKFATKIIEKLRRFDVCAEDGQDVDIGRHWLDMLVQLGLLNRVQRSPALWEIAQQGEDVLEGYTHPPKAQAVPEWISVDDLLPDADLEVLTSIPGVDGYELDYVDVCADTGSEWFANDPHRAVTLWLQIPQPPQEGE